ncbi:MAG: zinc dependent phospholipase C family protein [Solirubrobacterales bacterium]
MPAVAAHYYFGHQVLKQLPKEIQNIIYTNMEAFNLGLQGPDLFFFYKPLKSNPVTSYGHHIHSIDADYIISNAVDSIKKSKDIIELSYIFGYVCHFILDSSLHGKISKIAPEDIEHKFLEAEIDRQIIKQHYNEKPDKFKRYKLIEINISSSEWLKNIYREINIEDIKKSLRGFRFYMKILYCSFHAKKAIIEYMEKKLNREGEFSSMIVNSDKDERYYHSGKELCEGFNELENKGVKAILNINSAFLGEDVLSEVFKFNFL